MRKAIQAVFIFVIFLFPLVLSSCATYPVRVPVDSDKDGVYDNYDYRHDFTKPQYYDKCPTSTPAGAKVDEWGCPVDTDKDGVPDDFDKCPGTPAGVKVDKVGCPIDSDGDGVPDYLDRCAGTPAGVKTDQDGCPAAGIEEAGRAALHVEFDTGKFAVKKKYHEEIGQLAAAMKNNPNLKIRLEGHTDNVGGAAYNEKLSKRRVDAVKKYMVETFGIEASRLNTKGYGLTRPIAPNTTEEGRQKNRRVEAVVE